MTLTSLPGLIAQPFDPSRDMAAALALINADRLAGQPICTEQMLSEAVAGRSTAGDGGSEGMAVILLVNLSLFLLLFCGKASIYPKVAESSHS